MNKFLISEPMKFTSRIKKFDRQAHTIAVSLFDDVIRPAIDGQPQDGGRLVIAGQDCEIEEVVASGGDVWLILNDVADLPIVEGATASVEIDTGKRRAISKCHSLQHVLMRVLGGVVEDFEHVSAQIENAGTSVHIEFRTTSVVDRLALNMIDCVTRHFVLRNAPITIETIPAISDGPRIYKRWRHNEGNVPAEGVRVVNIDGIDACPCNGTHVQNTGEIGSYALVHDFTCRSGVYRLKAELTRTWMYWFGEGALIDFDFEALHHKRGPI